MRRIIFIVAGIISLIVIFSAIYTFFGIPKFSSIKNFFSSENQEQIYKLPPVVINLSDKHFLRVKISLSVLGDIKEVEEKRPVLIDNVIIISSGFSSTQLLSVEGKELLKEKLILNFNSILNKSKVKDIYYEEFVVQ